MLKNINTAHIIAEVVILSLMVFWFTSKNKRLVFHIDRLYKKLDKSEEKVKLLEAKIDNIIQRLSQQDVIPPSPVASSEYFVSGSDQNRSRGVQASPPVDHPPQIQPLQDVEQSSSQVPQSSHVPRPLGSSPTPQAPRSPSEPQAPRESQSFLQPSPRESQESWEYPKIFENLPKPLPPPTPQPQTKLEQASPHLEEVEELDAELSEELAELKEQA